MEENIEIIDMPMKRTRCLPVLLKNKIEYKATISRNRKDVVLDIKSKDFNVSLDSTPIYIKIVIK